MCKQTGRGHRSRLCWPGSSTALDTGWSPGEWNLNQRQAHGHKLSTITCMCTVSHMQVLVRSLWSVMHLRACR